MASDADDYEDEIEDYECEEFEPDYGDADLGEVGDDGPLGQQGTDAFDQPLRQGVRPRSLAGQALVNPAERINDGIVHFGILIEGKSVAGRCTGNVGHRGRAKGANKRPRAGRPVRRSLRRGRVGDTPSATHKNTGHPSSCWNAATVRRPAAASKVARRKPAWPRTDQIHLALTLCR